MLQPSTTLAPPKTGRSRFSKALPSVPGLHDDDAAAAADSSSPPPSKDLPRLPPPSPIDVSISMTNFNPSRSPLPPLPAPSPTHKTTASQSGPPPSKMAIPRRPVGGKPQVSNQAPTPAPTVAAVPPPASTPAVSSPAGLAAPALPSEPHSPNDSLSSLLSAYSRSSDDLVLRSSDGTAGSAPVHVHVRDFDDDASPMVYEPPPHAPTAGRAEPSQHLSPSSSTASSNSEQPKAKSQTVARKPAPALDRSLPLPPPPPPTKDEPPTSQLAQPQSQPQNQRPASPPSTNPDLTLGTPSPPRAQIWRRRSLKGSRELPNLKLDYSHGSTADTQAPPADPDRTPAPAPAVPAKAERPPAAALKTSPLPPPPSAAGGLPGRNVRPVPPKEPAGESQTMGHGASKLKHLKDKLRSSHRSQGSSSSSKTEATQRPSANRPPTPEYQKEDIKTPVVDTFISPVSPASSPEPAKEVSPNISKQLPPEPPKEPAKTEQKPVARKAVAPPAPSLHAAKSLPDLKVSTTTTPANEPPLPIRSAVDTRRQSPASEAAYGRGGESARPATRDGSMRPDGHRIPYPRPDSDPRLVRSDSRGTMYRGRTGILYPEMKALREPDPRAFNFPVQVNEPLPYGAIIKAMPLRESHYNCFQKHRSMKRILNRNYPLSCQTCDKEDTEDRWSCSFCHLRVCESCSRALDGQKKDLHGLMNTVRANNASTLSLSSPSRPGSALGLTFT